MTEEERPASIGQPQGVAAVVIGRNEGARLEGCLRSVKSQARRVVYVDSGSTDQSIRVAQDCGVEVVQLDPSSPYTAARGRNAGFLHLCQGQRPPAFVQVVDGDCIIEPRWIATALEKIRSDPRVGIVCGRRREEFPEKSVYNQLCDMEWDTAIGETDACGGDALIRTQAFQEVGGYNLGLIAGEDPEFSYRVRRAGWRIWRIDAPMTQHDAGIHRFGQWWTRSVRAGHAFVECCLLHRRSGGFRTRRLVSIIAWGGALPVAAVCVALGTHGIGLLLLPLGLAVLWLRVYRSRRRRGNTAAHAGRYARYCVMGKTAEFAGVLLHLVRAARGDGGALIEYHAAPGDTRPTKS